MNRRAIEAGRAHVTVEVNDKTKRQLNSLQSRMRRFGKQMKAELTTLGRIGAAGLGAGLVVAVKRAGDAQEVMSKFNVVFGQNAAAVKKWGDDLAATLGRSETQVAQFAASTQDLFVPLGFSATKAEQLSKQVTKLAFDLGSFNNMADADVLRDLQAALTGSGEVMKKYGVIVSETRVKQELFNMGLDPKAADDQQKALARLNIIMAGTQAAQGDAARTSGSFNNQIKRLTAAFDDLAVAVGTVVLPKLTELLVEVNEALKEFRSRRERVNRARMARAGIADPDALDENTRKEVDRVLKENRSLSIGWRMLSAHLGPLARYNPVDIYGQTIIAAREKRAIQDVTRERGPRAFIGTGGGNIGLQLGMARMLPTLQNEFVTKRAMANALGMSFAMRAPAAALPPPTAMPGVNLQMGMAGIALSSLVEQARAAAASRQMRTAGSFSAAQAEASARGFSMEQAQLEELKTQSSLMNQMLDRLGFTFS